MMKEMNMIESALKNRQIPLVITVILAVLGVFGLLKMPRNEYPEFTVRQGLVIGIYPGASSSQVEEQLTKRVEDYLFSFKEIDKRKTYSYSREGQMIIFVEVKEDVKRPEEFWARLRHGLNELKAQMPPGVQALFGNSDFGDTSALLLTVESGSRTYRELENLATSLQNEVRKIPEVSKITLSGTLPQQINVYVDNTRLSAYRIKPQMLMQALRMEGSVNFSGSVEDRNLVLPIRLGSRYNTENDLAEQIVYTGPDGSIVRLKDIAEIRREYQEPESYIKFNGRKTLLISLEMFPGHNIVQFGKEVDKAIEKAMSVFPQDVKVTKIVNQPSVVNASVGHFLKEFLIAVLAVIIVVMLLLPFRVAAVGGATIPITILMTLGIMYASGIELDTVTLAALIIVLGMVVDNAIVVIDNYVEKLDHGDKPWHAAWRSATELFIPVFVATLAIIATFFPLSIFMTGMASDFLGDFPVTVAIALSVSMFIAVLVVPFMNYVFIKTGLHKEGIEKNKKKKSLLDHLQGFYDRTLEKAFKHSSLTILAGVFAVGAGIFLMATLPQQLFPKTERNQFAVEVYLPNGQTLPQTGDIVKKLEDLLLKDKRITNVTSFTGASSPRFHTLYAPNLPARNYAQLIVNTISNEATIEILDEYSQKYSNSYSGAYVRWKQLEMLSASAPVEVRISGDSITDLKKTAAKVESIARKIKDATWVRTDFEDMRQGIAVDMKADASNRLGFSRSIVSGQLAIDFNGFPATTIFEGDYPVPVKIITKKDKRDSYDDIRNEYVTSAITGATVPLRQVADIRPEWTDGQVVRRNGVRTLTVRVDISRTAIGMDVQKELSKEVEKLNLPPGVEISYGGEYEESVKYESPMAISLITSVLLVFMIVLFQFRRIKMVILIMITMPLSIFGIALGLKVMGLPFGFTSFMGLISLCGIVVRNGIILVDYALQLIKEHGMSLLEASLAAGKRRMRPIFLTSAAASVGVIPMIISKSLLWTPLGTVICFGLLFSMVLTLYMLPVLFWLFFRKEERQMIEEESRDQLHHLEDMEQEEAQKLHLAAEKNQRRGTDPSGPSDFQPSNA